MKFYSSAAEARAALGLAAGPDDEAVEARYPFYANDYYLKLIDPVHFDADPVARQIFPDAAELADATSSFDPLAEEEQMAAPKLIRRFADRVVLLVTAKCAMRCRFCFRKRTWTCGEKGLHDLSDEELEADLHYLASHPEIHEVLVSGGDPLMLPEERLKTIVSRLAALPSLDVLRIGSRMPVVWPERVTPELCEFFGSVPGLWFATHFNCPQELTQEAVGACTRLICAGVPVVNQTVLLKGVNDSPEILEELFRKLIAIRVKPHYLFHVDPVRGVRHFATGIERGLEILRAFRPRLSSLAVPTFAIDLPEGGGKVALQPEYGKDGKYPDIHNQKWIKYETEL